MFIQFLKKRLSYIFLVIFLLVLTFNIYIAIQNGRIAQDDQKWIDRTYSILNETKSTLLIAKDLQIISRGFVITGDSSFLARLDQKQQDIYQHFQELTLLTKENPVQQTRMSLLRSLIDERIDIIQQNNDLKRTKGFEAVSRFISSGISRKNMESIERLIALIEAEENKTLNIRKQSNAASIHELEKVLYFLSVFALMVGVIEFILILKTDKLQQKVTEQALEIESKARRFEKLLENSFEGIVLLDENLNYIYKSSFAERVTGYSIDERDAATGIQQIHPEDKPVFENTLLEIRSQPGRTREIHYRILHKNGHYVWIQSFITNRLNQKDVEAIVFNFRDVTLKMEMEKQKDIFLNMVSHELKTPVTSLKVITHVLTGQLERNKDFENIRYLQKMADQTNRLIRLINDLMDLNKIGDTAFTFRHEVFNLAQTLAEATEEIQLLTTTHRIHFKAGDNAEDTTVLGDQERITQVLVNLLTNAIKYSPGEEEIIVSVAIQGNEVICTVEDFGIGIEDEDHSKVFERFFRSQKSVATLFPGLGIGLYISAEFIRAHQGRIWIESKADKGTTFCFSLPLYKEQIGV